MKAIHDHVVAVRAVDDDKHGELIVPGKHKVPMHYGYVIRVGGACKEVKESDIVFFDDAESRNFVIPIDGGMKEIRLVVLCEASCYMTMSQKEAKDLGLKLDRKPPEARELLKLVEKAA